MALHTILLNHLNNLSEFSLNLMILLTLGESRAKGWLRRANDTLKEQIPRGREVSSDAVSSRFEDEPIHSLKAPLKEANLKQPSRRLKRTWDSASAATRRHTHSKTRGRLLFDNGILNIFLLNPNSINRVHS